MRGNELIEEITRREGGRCNLTIAQVGEVLAKLMDFRAENPLMYERGITALYSRALDRRQSGTTEDEAREY